MSHKETWYEGESLHERILTYCALESCRRRLNAVLKASPSLEDFAKSLYAFDMKNYHELKVNLNNNQLHKYQLFLKKKDKILHKMDCILGNLKDGNNNEKESVNITV